MKKFIIFLLVLLAVAAVAVVTCPDRQAHKDAIMSIVNERINEVMWQDENSDLALLGSAIGSSVASYALDNRLTYKNHFVYSTCEINREDGPWRLSVGVFGHVFTFSKEDLDRALAD